jgi:hypothetical protein
MTAIPKKIVWLASYPKSGNTWFRAFLTALLNDGNLDINNMKSDAMFSSREVFDSMTGLDSTYLDMEEVNSMRPNVFNRLVQDHSKKQLFNKIHDAYTFTNDLRSIIPTECTKSAIYFIRNPLDIAGSLANHMNMTIDEAITFMNNSKQTLARQKNNLNNHNQFEQSLLDWSGHVQSWTLKLPFPVLVIRYEDMINDTLATFSNTIEFLRIDATENQIKTALEESSFEKLKNIETKSGFAEKVKEFNPFFRKGSAGNWEDELSSVQIRNIKIKNSKTMKIFNY